MGKAKILAVKFDRVDKAKLKTKGNTTRTGAQRSKIRHRAHGRIGPK